MRTILHIDFNSYFATVEQQANPRLRGKPIGVTGGDRLERTVLGAASVEAKKYGVKTGMTYFEAKRLCPQIILVKGDSDKYLECTKRFLNILKDYSPYLEVFSIDEAFLEIPNTIFYGPSSIVKLAESIKSRIRSEIGEWITCSIGISYNKLMAKLAGSRYKPDGLMVIADEKAAQFILDQVDLDEVCGIGPRIKKRLNNMGILNFTQLRKAPKEALLASFKSYGEVLYNMARGIDHTPVVPFYQREEVKSIGHRHTLGYDTADPVKIKQVLLKLTELIARRLRSKRLLGKTVHCWYRLSSLDTSDVVTVSTPGVSAYFYTKSGSGFEGGGMQATIPYTQDGLEIFQAAWRMFNYLWDGRSIRMIGASISNLKPVAPSNLSFLPEERLNSVINNTLDLINNKYGEFTLQRGILLTCAKVYRKPNPYLSDRRFKL